MFIYLRNFLLITIINCIETKGTVNRGQNSKMVTS